MATKCVVSTPASLKLGSLTRAALIPLCSMGQWDESFVSPNDPADARVEMAYKKVKKLLNSKDYPTHTAGQDIAFLLEEVRDRTRFSYSDHPVFIEAYKEHPTLLDDMKQIEVRLNTLDWERNMLEDHSNTLKELGEQHKHREVHIQDAIQHAILTHLVEMTYDKTVRGTKQMKINCMTEVARLHVEDSKRKRDQLTSGLKACQLDIEDMSSHHFTDLWQAIFWKQKDTCALGGKPIRNVPPFPLSEEWMARRIKFLMERTQIKVPEAMKREARDCKRMAKELVNPPWRILSKGMARMRALHIEKANEVLKSYIESPEVLEEYKDVPARHEYLQAMVEFDAAVSMYLPLSAEAEDLFLGVEEGCSLMHRIQELQSNEEKKLQLYSQMSDREMQDVLNVHLVTIVKHKGRYKLATVDRNKFDAELCKSSLGEKAILLFLDPRYITPEFYDYAPTEAGDCLTGPWTSDDKLSYTTHDIPPECQALFNERLRGRSRKSRPLDHHDLISLEPYTDKLDNLRRCIVCVESRLGHTWTWPGKTEYNEKLGNEELSCLRHKYRELSPVSREKNIRNSLAVMHEASAMPTRMPPAPSLGLNELR
eukprot:Blabericola_migrator_1__4814@NODE_2529_length_2641_cov_28_358197_g1581_i0_p1_GENE_NODE_2529_length_2641_cov_28_358197_g1581_i0NODE_2529_length_2641_cov_28_358197_g1581_i0_p1_ORF_typecomplete_len596_score79_62Occludin_ELL/PF07303_13/0_99Occludin_ELL/PF07303_13/1_4e03DNA_repr_REX1B/PF14966_6/2_9e03DNA_repr_REX1B/PF14966_6/7_6e03DNA_repr_REX1B/PF14966_6/0_5_NODE_2529_length_2641_cov_28_358197_g1581_i01441931